ncbi:MAG: 16S rRNA (guanine(527)-N(7))-methyltransferase RsmG [Bryobacteraceae bacterium]|nr:16S rRNA (guanine(527)-N(7))-methyltransferase RsmG [Bryobacteraceae bacterium]
MTFADLGLPAAQTAFLERHYRLLIEWNRRINLTRVVDEAEAVSKHYGESLAVARLLPPGICTVADIGSGPGFPGIPIAVARPEIQVTLVESHQRKAVFLREATADLPNCRVLAVRAEDLDARFDAIVSRAVAPAEVAALVPRLAPQAWMLMSPDDVGSTWHVVASDPLVAFHVEQELR